MTLRNGAPRAAERGAGEQTPLLREERRDVDQDDGSEETLMDPEVSGSESGDEVVNDTANQQVGRGRGLLIILSLWGLIFLQG
jgi:hypothetical protein